MNARKVVVWGAVVMTALLALAWFNSTLPSDSDVTKWGNAVQMCKSSTPPDARDLYPADTVWLDC